MGSQKNGDGAAHLTGRLRRRPDTDTLVVLTHGLGGSADGVYMRRAARVADEMGLATLRLNLRGSAPEEFLPEAFPDGNTYQADFYHAGLSADLGAALAAPALRDFKKIFVLGYSLGGHMVLRLATEVNDPRVRAVAAVCPPIDLDRTVAGFDRPAAAVYRRYIFQGLFRLYEVVAAQRPLALGVERIRKVRKVREWDALTIAPRFGFASPEDYYQRAGVRLADLRRPALVVVGEADPMVISDANREALEKAKGNDLLEVHRVAHAGHIGFSPRVDLGLGERPGLEAQIFDWFQGGRARDVG